MYSSEFCKIYNEFGWNYFPEIFGEQLLEWLRRNSADVRSSLDIGCGTGVLCEILHGQGIEACGMDPAFYAQRAYEKDEVLPWQTIDVGVCQEFLWHERELSYQSKITPDCRTTCSGCGANKLEGGVKCDA